MKKILNLLGGAALLLVLFTQTAYAYLDPVTGSFIVQGIVGGIAAIMVGFRSFREKVINFFKGKSKSDE
jgi:hypothetical protein